MIRRENTRILISIFEDFTTIHVVILVALSKQKRMSISISNFSYNFDKEFTASPKMF
jgi:hypothetical protein